MKKDSKRTSVNTPISGEVQSMIEQFLTLGEADDGGAKSFIALMTRIAGDGETLNSGTDLAMIAARHAYTLTLDFEINFEKFAGQGRLPAAAPAGRNNPAKISPKPSRFSIGKIRSFISNLEFPRVGRRMMD